MKDITLSSLAFIVCNTRCEVTCHTRGCLQSLSGVKDGAPSSSHKCLSPLGLNRPLPYSVFSAHSRPNRIAQGSSACSCTLQAQCNSQKVFRQLTTESNKLQLQLLPATHCQPQAAAPTAVSTPAAAAVATAARCKQRTRCECAVTFSTCQPKPGLLNTPP